MDCIFNATFFQPLFCKKIKMSKKKHEIEALWLWTLSLSVRGVEVDIFRHLSSPVILQQGHLATSSPLGCPASTLQTSKLNVPL